MASTDSENDRRSFESWGANEGYAEELFALYRANPRAVPVLWQERFAAMPPAGGAPARNGGAPAPVAPAIALQSGDVLQPLRGPGARLAANMEASLTVPTATSQRVIPVRLMEENRRLINQQLAPRGAKISMTPLLGWAVVQAARAFPALNSACTRDAEGNPARVERAHVNLGLAVDVERASGRSLLVPVVKAADQMTFVSFYPECDRLIRAARDGKISPDDLAGATISLTNPGTIGTRASVPRLMAGQSAIIAAGAVAFPAGFEGVPEATLRVLGVGKTVTLSCTYDHRVVQGAESGSFLALVHALLAGEQGFYESIFADLGFTVSPFHLTAESEALAGAPDYEPIRKQAGVFQLAHAFRVRGHLEAAVDPLGFKALAPHPELDPAHYGLTVWDMDRRFACPLAGRNPDDTCTLRDIIDVLRATYCGSLACEYMHMQRLEERAWLQERLEPSQGRWPLPAALRRRILDKLAQAEAFEHLLHARFVGHKRFSLEGAEALIPAMDRLFDQVAASGAGQVVLGMSHRGRLNVLVTVLGLGMNEMFSKFEDVDPESVEGSGDVKYHIGAQGRHTASGGAVVEIELIPNPSHLEAVDPVVEGSARARQRKLADDGQRVIPVLIHGDAAFAGQGVVVETLNLSQLEGYRTGGTVHLVVNNQIGFTTAPAGARSSVYCTDVARTVQAPILHVNGDDPEAVVRAVDVAFEFRQRFQKDVVVDIVCYRRHGHNEADDPSLTAPVLYRKIDSHPSVRVIYGEALVKAGVITAEENATLNEAAKDRLSTAAAQPTAAASAAEPAPSALLSTGVAAGTLSALAERLATVPADFTVHPKLRTFLERRRQIAQPGTQSGVDWSLAEALALGSLALQGVAVRLSGQDSGRGTFSQRHAVLHDFQTARPYLSLAHLDPAQQPVEVFDSLLSEEAALGFEFGYSMTDAGALVLWEAQFGDFANGAQVVIDQFLACSQTKWGLTSGLTLLLPHGFEGQGPEHSSGRIERFLQLSADDNWRIVNCTTAAQYFHLLRSQGLASLTGVRRPLVVFTPKSLLRHPEVATPLDAFTQGKFEPLLPYPTLDDRHLRTAIFCSGKVYYDLVKALRSRPDPSVAILRIEQLYPFPAAAIQRELAGYPALRQVRWVQEEPQNMGAGTFLEPRLRALLPPNAELENIGRPASPSPATGSLRRHQQEQAAIVASALRPFA